jgi:hypothetical protein
VNDTLIIIGTACVVISLILEGGSYYKQIAKTLRTKRSSQVSSSAFVLKIAKYLITLIALCIYNNWLAFWIEVAALLFCSMALFIIIKYKPKNWSLWK